MKFSEIIKADSQLIQVPFQDGIINIKPYISIEDKYDFATIIMQQSMEDNGLYNPIKIEKYFNLYLAYMFNFASNSSTKFFNIPISSEGIVWYNKSNKPVVSKIS